MHTYSDDPAPAPWTPAGEVEYFRCLSEAQEADNNGDCTAARTKLNAKVLAAAERAERRMKKVADAFEAIPDGIRPEDDADFLRVYAKYSVFRDAPDEFPETPAFGKGNRFASEAENGVVLALVAREQQERLELAKKSESLTSSTATKSRRQSTPTIVGERRKAPNRSSATIGRPSKASRFKIDDSPTVLGPKRVRSNAPTKQTGDDLLGCEVELFWENEDEWYHGVITRTKTTRSGTIEYEVKYDDGEVHWELYDKDMRVLAHDSHQTLTAATKVKVQNDDARRKTRASTGSLPQPLISNFFSLISSDDDELASDSSEFSVETSEGTNDEIGEVEDRVESDIDSDDLAIIQTHRSRNANMQPSNSGSMVDIFQQSKFQDDEILDERFEQEQKEFLVAWKNPKQRSKNATWEPAANVPLAAVAAYRRSQGKNAISDLDDEPIPIADRMGTDSSDDSSADLSDDDDVGEPFEVEKILNHQKAGSGHRYLILWKGYPPDEATWEPTTHIDDPSLISSYWEQYWKSKERSREATKFPVSSPLARSTRRANETSIEKTRRTLSSSPNALLASKRHSKENLSRKPLETDQGSPAMKLKTSNEFKKAFARSSPSSNTRSSSKTLTMQPLEAGQNVTVSRSSPAANTRNSSASPRIARNPTESFKSVAAAAPSAPPIALYERVRRDNRKTVYQLTQDARALMTTETQSKLWEDLLARPYFESRDALLRSMDETACCTLCHELTYSHLPCSHLVCMRCFPRLISSSGECAFCRAEVSATTKLIHDHKLWEVIRLLPGSKNIQEFAGK